MIRHIVTWKLKDGFTEAEKKANALKVKEAIEALVPLIEGIVSLEVIIDALPTSNRDLVLNSLYTSEESLAAYQVHPAHVKVSQEIGQYLADRACIDYYEE